ncbi:MAG TPA: hypothetical protein VFD82_09995 [Planctomycetota bacterium]|nr:hypothetical protein [Planctomycetota bacterium]
MGTDPVARQLVPGPVDKLRDAVRAVIAAGSPPLPRDLLADLLRLAAAAAGNDAARTGSKSERAAQANSTLGSEGGRGAAP